MRVVDLEAQPVKEQPRRSPVLQHNLKVVREGRQWVVEADVGELAEQ